MATTVAVSAQTAAATSSNIAVADGSSIKVWVSEPLGEGEAVTVLQTDNSSVEVKVVEYDEDERRPIPVQITPGVTALRLVGPGFFKLSKSVTSDSVAVYYDS